jgi:3-methylfumaryl-CoA hydratase
MTRRERIKPGDKLPQREFKVDVVQSFLYNAVLWNAHRIHFDEQYATESESYPGLVVAGPLMGDWLSQCVAEWMGDEAQLVSLEYQNRRTAYLGETLRSGGTVKSIDPVSDTCSLELFVTNETGEVLVPGSAVVRFVAD